ncbi:diguanylate cyclase [Marinobacteraceae bacterium S3BR75-40.1]
MSVQLKTALIVLGAGLALLFAFYLSAQQLLVQPFVQLERHQMEENLTRLENAFNSELAAMETLVRDWAEWDDTYAYMQQPNSAYETSNIMASTFETLEVDHILYLTPAGEIFRTFSYHPDNSTRPEVLNVLEGLFERLYGTSAQAHERHTGIYAANGKVWLLSAAPILTSELKGPSRGVLVMVRRFTEQTIEGLAERTRLQSQFLTLDAAKRADLETAWNRAVAAGTDIAPVSEEAISGYRVFRDILGQPTLLARINQPRNIYQEGLATVRKNLLFWFLAVVAMTLLVLGLLRQVVLKRLQRLSQSARELGEEGATASRIDVTSRDEIGQVKIAINDMLLGLEKAYQQRRVAEERQRLQNELLLDLARKVADCNHLQEAARWINAAAISGLRASRSSIWLLEDGGRRKLYGLDVFNPPDRHYSPPQPLLREEHPDLFEKLDEMGLGPARDSGMLAALRERMVANEGFVGGTHWLLPARYEGATVGLLFIESDSGEEAFTPDERMFATSVTEFMTQALSNCQRRQMEAKLRQLASYDPLTGLANRSCFLERLQSALARAQDRPEARVGLLYLDLDGFKPINDALGHEAGDHLLKTLATRFADAVRSEDTVARIGGDEFTVLLDPLHNAEDSLVVARKLLEAAELPVNVGKGTVSVGCSIGIAVYPDDAANAKELINHADAAMYRAKDHGGSGYVLYTQTGVAGGLAPD